MSDLGSVWDEMERAPLREQAEALREQIASDLERLATYVRVEHYSPYAVVVVLLEPEAPTLAKVGKMTWETLREARSALGYADGARYSYTGYGGNVIKAMQEGAKRTRRYRREVVEKDARTAVERPYKCPHCTFRSHSERGRDQHVRTQTGRLACTGCGAPRCAGRGGRIIYGNDYRGTFTCAECCQKERDLAAEEEA